jgi:hypothetical protein
MRTTLNIDNDVLEAAKELARMQKISVGQVVSQLLRKILTGQSEIKKIIPVAGFRPFPAGKAFVTNSTVNRLREDIKFE